MEELDEIKDEKLVSISLDGDMRAFDEIVRRHQTMIARCLYRFCPHQSDLEDMVQDTFIKAYRKLHLWKPKASFDKWLRAIAYNTGYDYFRKNIRNPASIAITRSEKDEGALDRISTTDEGLQSYEAGEQAQYILSYLEAEDRMLLTLQYLQEMPLADIAAQMGWGLSKTKVKSFRARKKLKKELINHGIATEIVTEALIA